jgi:hypothetical protein
MTRKAKRLGIEELEFLEKYLPDKRSEFLSDYLERYGKDKPMMEGMPILKRAYYIWEKRDGGMKHLEKLREKAHTVMIPTVIKKKMDSGKRKGDSLPDVGELLVKCHNVLIEIASIQREHLELFKKLSIRG